MVIIRMALEEGETPPPIVDRILAIAVFPFAVAILRLMPLRGTFAIAHTVKKLIRRPASLHEAERAVCARAWVARWFPGRAACLEVSFAAFLISAARGRSVDWCIGCRFRPAESHAWIETLGQPVGESYVADRPFHVTIRI
jgi:hypothetical protein